MMKKLLIFFALIAAISASAQTDLKLNFVNIQLTDSIYVDSVMVDSVFVQVDSVRTNNPQLHLYKIANINGRDYPLQDRLYLSDSADVKAYCEPYKADILRSIRYLEGILTEEE